MNHFPSPTQQDEVCRVKGPWSPEEDRLLKRLVLDHGPQNWFIISRQIPGRTGKSCRLRWCNQLSPNVVHARFTKQEDDMIIQAHAIYGNKWATIARLLRGRTNNAIKNRWNSTLQSKRLSSVKKCVSVVGSSKRPSQRSNIGRPGESSSLLSELYGPGGPSMSDVRNNLGRPRVIRPVPRVGGFPMTRLSLSLPGVNFIDSAHLSSVRVNSEPIQINSPPPSPIFDQGGFGSPLASEMEPVQKLGEPMVNEPGTSFSAGFGGVNLMDMIQEVIRTEVKNCMEGFEHKDLFRWCNK